MAKKKATAEEARTLREQLNGHISSLVDEFEFVTGLRVVNISIRRGRKIGFGATDEITIDTTIDL